MKLPNNWQISEGKLHREYKFPNFEKAIEFMNSCIPEIEKINHHPDWFNSYNKVVVDLTTHDQRKITNLDYELAEIIEKNAQKFLFLN